MSNNTGTATGEVVNASAPTEPGEAEPRSRKDGPKPSIHFGDNNFEEALQDEGYGDATWGDVGRTCCIHTGEEWAYIGLGTCLVFFFLYFFLFGLELLSTGAKVMSGCKAGELFGDDTNPVAGLMIGILATVLMQSSSATTSIFISLIGSAISVRQGIYMVMGANIGTTITNTLVALGQLGDGDQLERAFAGATVHDMFNYCTVALLFPLELATGYLYHLTKAMVKNIEEENTGEAWEGPVKKLVAPFAERLIISNKKVTESIAKGKGDCSEGGMFYPMNCTDDDSEVTADTCHGKFGLIGCNKDTGDCPAFFQIHATAKDDKVSGGVCFFLGICILFVCLIGLVAVLQRLMMGVSTRIVYKATNMNGYVSMVIGCAITVMVQSSSITTSTLTPIVGLGAIRLEQMYPLTLGANIGTTITGIMAALVKEGPEGMQVALAHLFFNLTGIAIFYPVPFMRNIPMRAARSLGKATKIWRGFPFLYICVVFFLIPLLFLGISSLFQKDSMGFTVLGSLLVVMAAMALMYTAYWYKYRDGQAYIIQAMEKRERRRLMNEALPDNMDLLLHRVTLLSEHAGLVFDDENKTKNEKEIELHSESSKADKSGSSLSRAEVDEIEA